MPDFNVRSDSVNVEQIMEQIRARIREKRGVDYTEQQIRELAAVKLEKFLDPRGVRSDLLEQFRRTQPPYEPPELPNYAFEDDTLFESHRAPLRWIRKLLRPILKLFFNPNPLIQALHIQSRLNTMNAEREASARRRGTAIDQLHYEVMHNLVVETTRTRHRGEEPEDARRVARQPARVQRASRPRARERRRLQAAHRERARRRPPPQQRAAVAKQPPRPASRSRPTPRPTGAARAGTAQRASQPEGPGQRSRRRRRRRGRRGGALGAPR